MPRRTSVNDRRGLAVRCAAGATICRTLTERRAFWAEFQPGYDAFEQTKVPLRLKTVNGQCVVEGRD